ncbi:inositol monophosphatase [Candidatus Parcubacteria bacterium]|nr:MAG: inositol monophosphatase [Candidatus Parcubacteria bacterium]
MYELELKISQQAARKAGHFLKKEFFLWDSKKINYKKGNERVTWCDKGAEKIILQILNKNFPSYSRLSEESGSKDRDSDYIWIIDPLDGTTNFTVHHPLFSVSIALLYKNNLVLGLTYSPITDEMYWATKNQGAYKDGQKIKVSNVSDFKKSVVTYCHGSGPNNRKKAHKLYEHFHNICHHCRHFGSTSMELAMLASGDTEAFMVSGARLWDVAAGIILAQEAGAKVSDWQGQKWNIESKSILVGNKKIHALCQKELKKIKLA